MDTQAKRNLVERAVDAMLDFEGGMYYRGAWRVARDTLRDLEMTEQEIDSLGREADAPDEYRALLKEIVTSDRDPLLRSRRQPVQELAGEALEREKRRKTLERWRETGRV